MKVTGFVQIPSVEMSTLLEDQNVINAEKIEKRGLFLKRVEPRSENSWLKKVVDCSVLRIGSVKAVAT